MTKIKGIIFDYGETLISEGVYDRLKGMEAILALVRHKSLIISPKDMTALSFDYDKALGRVKGKIEDFPSFEYPERIALRYIFDYYQLKFERSFDELEYVFWNGATSATKKDMAREMLELIQSRGIRNGLISNISFSSYALAKRLENEFPDIGFDFIISSSDVGFRKPQARIFDLAYRHWNMEKEEILFIGDRLDADVNGALDYGFKAGFYKSNNKIDGDCKADYIINHWGEFIKIVKSNQDFEMINVAGQNIII